LAEALRTKPYWRGRIARLHYEFACPRVILVSTVLTLVVIPVLYYVVCKAPPAQRAA
jgi:hypothetical protein